jgi:ABC-type nitrate/sulfonate/bicarbonate transport system substrate-binding protein
MASPFNTWLCTYGIREGLVTSDKVDVEITLAADYETQILAGNYQMGAMATATFAVATQTSNIPLKALSTFILQAGAQKSEGVNYLLTLAGSPITSPKDLSGKKVGVPELTGSGTSVFLALLKKEYGINEDQLVLVNKSNTLLMELLKKGEIDAALLGQNTGVQAALDTKTYKVIWNLDEAFVDEYGAPFVASLVVVDENYRSQNAAAVKAAWELLKESNKYGEDHIAELAPKYAAEFGQTAEFYQLVFNEHSRSNLVLIEGKTQESLMAIFQFVKDRGVIAALPDPKLVFRKP